MLNLLAKLTQSLFLIKQCAPAPSRKCRPLSGFLVQTDNDFLQSYGSAYSQGFQNPPHRNGDPAAWVIPVQADTPHDTENTAIYHTALEKAILVPRVFPLAAENEECRAAEILLSGRSYSQRSVKRPGSIRGIICHLHHFLVFFCSPILCLIFFKGGKFLLPPLHTYSRKAQSVPKP